MLFHTVLHILGPMPHLADVAVNPADHGLAPVTHLADDREYADRRSRIERPEAARSATASSSFRKSVTIAFSPVLKLGNKRRLGGCSAR